MAVRTLELDAACAEAVDYALERGHVGGPAGAIVEPLQANGGMVPAPEGYLQKVHGICKDHDVPLIVDEVQGSLCRTGPIYASEAHGVEPEMIVLGKALGGGILPVSAVVSRDEVLGVLRPGEHGSTFGGNPLALAIARDTPAPMLNFSYMPAVAWPVNIPQTIPVP